MNDATYAYLLSLAVLRDNSMPGPKGGCFASDELQFRMYQSLTEAERPEAFLARRTLKTLDVFAKWATAT